MSESGVPEDCPLTISELNVLRCVAGGQHLKEIAHASGRSYSTVRGLLGRAYKRLGVSNCAQAMAACAHAGWLDQRRPVNPKVTWAQRLYLEAFDQLLGARDGADQQRARLLMDAALQGVYREAELEQPPWRALQGHPLERIAATLRRLDGTES